MHRGGERRSHHWMLAQGTQRSLTENAHLRRAVCVVETSARLCARTWEPHGYKTHTVLRGCLIRRSPWTRTASADDVGCIDLIHTLHLLTWLHIWSLDAVTATVRACGCYSVSMHGRVILHVGKWVFRIEWCSISFHRSFLIHRHILSNVPHSQPAHTLILGWLTSVFNIRLFRLYSRETL